SGAMARRDLHAVMERDVVERTPTQLRQQLARELHRAESPPVERPAGDTAHFGGDEAPIERRVVRHEHASFQRAEQLTAYLVEGRRAPHHVPRDAREPGDERRNGSLRIDERLEQHAWLAAIHFDRGDLDDAIAMQGARARRFHVDDYIGESVEPGVARGIRDGYRVREMPAAVLRAPEPPIPR